MSRKPRNGPEKRTKSTSPFEVLKHVNLSAPKAPKTRTTPRERPAEEVSSPSPPPSTRAPRDEPRRERTYDERVLLNKAYSGVAPLRDERTTKRRVAKKPPDPRSRAAQAAADATARARLDALVGGGERFVIERDTDGVLFARRMDASPRTETALFRDTSSPERRIDLHGLRAEEAKEQVVRFVRDAQHRGAKRVLIVHGRGTHSAGGVGVLAEVVVEVLSAGGAAPIVRAFCRAPLSLGGAGALLVHLREPRRRKA